MHFKIVTTKKTANEIKEWFDVISDKKNKIRSSCRLDRIEHSEQFSEVTITANDGWKVKPEDVFRLGYNCRKIDYKELAKAIKSEDSTDPTANIPEKDRQFIDKMIAELREAGYSYDDMGSIFREAGRKYQDFKSRMEKIGVKAIKKTQVKN